MKKNESIKINYSFTSRFLMKSGINHPIYIANAAKINTNLSDTNIHIGNGSESIKAAIVYEIKQAKRKMPLTLFSLVPDFIKFNERMIPKVIKAIAMYNAYNDAIPAYFISTIDSNSPSLVGAVIAKKYHIIKNTE